MNKSTDNNDTSTSGIQINDELIKIPDLIAKCVQSAKDMYQAVYNINTEMTELAKISNATSVQLSNALESATESAKNYGSTISDVINLTNKSLSSTLSKNQSNSIDNKMNSPDISGLINKLFPDIKNVGRVKLIACPQF